jgi:hypothetical protein
MYVLQVRNRKMKITDVSLGVIHTQWLDVARTCMWRVKQSKIDNRINNWLVTGFTSSKEHKYRNVIKYDAF